MIEAAIWIVKMKFCICKNHDWTFYSRHMEQKFALHKAAAYIDFVFSAGYSSRMHGTERLWWIKSRWWRKVFDIFCARTPRFGLWCRHSSCSTSRWACTVVLSFPSSSSFYQKFGKHTKLKCTWKCSLPINQTNNTGKRKFNMQQTFCTSKYCEVKIWRQLWDVKNSVWRWKVISRHSILVCIQ